MEETGLPKAKPIKPGWRILHASKNEFDPSELIERGLESDSPAGAQLQRSDDRGRSPFLSRERVFDQVDSVLLENSVAVNNVPFNAACPRAPSLQIAIRSDFNELAHNPGIVFDAGQHGVLFPGHLPIALTSLDGNDLIATRPRIEFSREGKRKGETKEQREANH